MADFYRETVANVNGDQEPHAVFECIDSLIVQPLAPEPVGY